MSYNCLFFYNQELQEIISLLYNLTKKQNHIIRNALPKVKKKVYLIEQ